MRQIVTSRRLRLGSSFCEIKSRIKTDARYDSLIENKLCCFDSETRELIYCTETIYPDRSKHAEKSPVLFLFSNPHPDSVALGLFLSERHSKTFWQRLSEINKNYLKLPSGVVNLERWAESIPRIAEIMLKGEYESPFLFYFHCLYPIPTNMLKDLKGLFKSTPHIWEEIKMSSNRELAELIENCRIKHIVTFNVEVFRTVTKSKVKGWRKKEDLDEFLKSGDKDKYWGVDVDGRCFYLSLNTKAKNWKDDKGQYYFTRFLNSIFAKIIEKSS